jgi:hypothetical protein
VEGGCSTSLQKQLFWTKYLHEGRQEHLAKGEGASNLLLLRGAPTLPLNSVTGTVSGLHRTTG